MALRFFLFLNCVACLMASDEGTDTFRVRVALLRNVPTLDQALRALGEQEYMDTVRVVKNRQGSYDAVNILDVEDFLIGVIGREMSPSAPLEALKAQAVSARSHALYQTVVSGQQTYDLVANLSQAYGGKTKLHKNIVLAIEATRGQVLYFNGKPIPAFFHSSCGGHTEPAASVWETIHDIQTASVLKLPEPVRCPYCAKSDEQKWQFQISVATLARVLKQAGHTLGASPLIQIAKKGSGGHAISISILSSTGRLDMAADKFRSLLGYSSLKSTLFEVHRETDEQGLSGDLFTFQGGGYGHGVGLCQYGAQEMAANKISYSKILSYYFPQSSIRSYGTKVIASIQ